MGKNKQSHWLDYKDEELRKGNLMNFFSNIANAFSILTPKEVKILRMRFGIGYNKIYTLKEIGRRCGRPPQSIWLKEKRALMKLEDLIYWEKIKHVFGY